MDSVETCLHIIQLQPLHKYSLLSRLYHFLYPSLPNLHCSGFICLRQCFCLPGLSGILGGTDPDHHMQLLIDNQALIFSQWIQPNLSSKTNLTKNQPTNSDGTLRGDVITNKFDVCVVNQPLCAVLHESDIA